MGELVAKILTELGVSADELRSLDRSTRLSETASTLFTELKGWWTGVLQSIL